VSPHAMRSRPVTSLSSGQKQRVVMLRVLATAAAISLCSFAVEALSIVLVVMTAGGRPQLYRSAATARSSTRCRRHRRNQDGSKGHPCSEARHSCRLPHPQRRSRRLLRYTSLLLQPNGLALRHLLGPQTAPIRRRRGGLSGTYRSRLLRQRLLHLGRQANCGMARGRPLRLVEGQRGHFGLTGLRRLRAPNRAVRPATSPASRPALR